MIRLLAISGSLRRASTNSALLGAFRANAPEGVTIVITSVIGDLPIFNPDLEGDLTPPSVLRWAEEVRVSDGMIIACPEYAHGIPGGLKNALDWLVSRDEIPHKPVMLVSASHRGDHVRAALAEVLRTMSLSLVPEPIFAVPLLGKKADELERILTSAEAREAMVAAMGRLLVKIGEDDV
jgi:chromate reductase, NAD(P)H dehydrogenase (quinone)